MVEVLYFFWNFIGLSFLVVFESSFVDFVVWLMFVFFRLSFLNLYNGRFRVVLGVIVGNIICDSSSSFFVIFGI